MLNEIYIEITVDLDSPEQGEVLLAQINEVLNIEGVEEMDSQLKFYFKSSNFNENLFNNIIELNSIKYSKSVINSKNWNEEWESNYTPVIVDEVGIRADFHPRNSEVKYDIVVTPKMSFGTGHHATTSMMVKAITGSAPAGKRVIDFGTGTGVLAILAHKMGAKEIVAIDYDDWSIENAAENFEKNNCADIQLQKLDHFPEAAVYDIILANINLNVITDNIEAISKGLAANGVLLVSGILKTDLTEILKISLQYGLVLKKQSEKNNWLCIAFKKEHFG